MVEVGLKSASTGWRITQSARSQFLLALEEPKAVSTRLRYTFSRNATRSPKQVDIAGSSDWHPLTDTTSMRNLIQAIDTGGDPNRRVKDIVRYPLYLNLPQTGTVKTINDDPIMVKTSLGYNNDDVEGICKHGRGAEPGMCQAEQTWRNTSMGADVGFFTLHGNCNMGSPGGLCFILVNDMLAPSSGLTSTILAQADNRAPRTFADPT